MWSVVHRGTVLTLLIEALRAFPGSPCTARCHRAGGTRCRIQGGTTIQRPGTAGWKCEGHRLGMQVLKDEDGRDAIWGCRVGI